MNLSLQHKTALVCGSTQGIGKAAAIELATLGARVILMARNEEKLKAVQAELQVLQPNNHGYIVADFAHPESVKNAIDQFLAGGETVNILVNNTGGPPAGKIAAAQVDEFRIAFNSHLINNHILAAAVMDGMKKSGYGRIINVISTSVKIPLHGLGVSNTIRGAVASWSKTLANELGQFGITVNNVLPGATNTIRLQNIIQNKANTTGHSTHEVMDEMAGEVPMKRVAEPEEIAAAIAFLASPAASYINGINLPVDGGRTGSL